MQRHISSAAVPPPLPVPGERDFPPCESGTTLTLTLSRRTGRGDRSNAWRVVASLLITLVATACAFAQTRATSQPAKRPPAVPGVQQGRDGQLVYADYPRGDRVPDFSYAGYRAGEDELPTYPTFFVVEPQDGDDTSQIQAAIDATAKLHVSNRAVLLKPGRYEIAGSLRLRGGIVLRGSGIDQTTLVATGSDRRTLIAIGAESGRTPNVESARSVVDNYVPVGATTLRVGADHRFAVGHTVSVSRPSTAEWIAALGMDRFAGDRHGGQWKPGSRDITWDRTITAVTDDSITLDAPLTTALDRTFGDSTVTEVRWSGPSGRAGVENLRLVSEVPASGNLKDEDHSWIAIQIDNAFDCWVRRVDTEGFVAGAVWVMPGARRVTIEDVLYRKPVSEIAGQRRMAFFVAGQQVLVQNCYAEDAINPFTTGLGATGPTAFVQCDSINTLGACEPLDSWASGILYDNVRIDGNVLALRDRDFRLQQSGWTAANSMLWQCQASVIDVSNPPTARNWAIGCVGQFAGDGEFAASRDGINPDSIFHAQLRARVPNVDPRRTAMMLDAGDPTSSPSPEQAAAQIAASVKPQPTMSEWIARRAKENPLPVDATNVRVFEYVASAAPATKPVDRITVKNGWLVHSDGRVVIGKTTGVKWWAGGTRPDDIEAAVKGVPALTRFVPGYNGPGTTDDLPSLVDSLAARGVVAVSHHHGLWYDTRSADHERIRRMDGDVWPPFYEQPLARSGQGLAWDGLSKYDLTKFNPWYWSRLRQYAELADQHGMLLLQQHYFQHNILEAGAHWASYPWRSANNINDTGFPEPVPYAGDKRVFMAEQFYDLSNARRRSLHEALIRQSLANFDGVNNVIHFTGEEFTGPLAFTQFWVDTVAAYAKEQGVTPLVAISATKDVQDAILADAERAKTIDVINIQYWWMQPDGTYYAPESGKNLAPRQWMRTLKPKAPDGEATAKMIAGHRLHRGEKAVICAVDGTEKFAWEQLMAGASLAPVPATTDPELLKAIATTRPHTFNAVSRTYVLVSDDERTIVTGPTKSITMGPGGPKALYELKWVRTADGKVIDTKRFDNRHDDKAVVRFEGELGLLWVTKLQE
jgi:hypothetical protein